MDGTGWSKAGEQTKPPNVKRYPSSVSKGGYRWMSRQRALYLDQAESDLDV